MFLDLGGDASHARRSFLLGPFSDLANDTFSDQSYTRFSAPVISYDFWLNEPRDALEVRIRAKAGSSSSLSASVDQVRLGTVRVRSEAFRTLAFPALKAPLAPGRHLLTLRWAGRPSGDGRPYGMAEWIHWAEPGQPLEEYRPERESSLSADVVLNGVPRRSIVLEAPASLSCPVQVVPGTELSLGLGFWGEGSGVARIIARREGVPPQVLTERRVTGSATAPWTDVSLKLDGLGSSLVELELNATSDSPGGRLAFSQPRILSKAVPVAPVRAKLVVLVVASGLHRELLPPFGENRRLRHYGQLADASARFPEYRVPTTVVGGVVASLLTGLPPLAHGLTTPRARLPATVLTLADRLHESSGESAMFTGVPQTLAAFGFDHGWNSYESFSPVNDVPATEPLERAKAWLERALQRDREPTRLVVVHLRGGHPPWDLSRDEVAELEPREYNGLLEARRGGLILSSIRSHPRVAQRRLSPGDWVRLHAMQQAALVKQDAALGSLIELLERTNAWDDTLFVFTGDVATGDPPEAPFGAARTLTEDRLLAPLWVKFPHARFAGSVVPGLVTSTDLAATLATALGVSLPTELGSLDLYRLASGDAPTVGRPLLASLEQEYATRWGRWLLRGSSGKLPLLCEISVDPACSHDVFAESPLAAEALWRVTFDEHERQRTLDAAVKSVEAATLDKDTAAALQVWGD